MHNLRKTQELMYVIPAPTDQNTQRNEHAIPEGTYRPITANAGLADVSPKQHGLILQSSWLRKHDALLHNWDTSVNKAHQMQMLALEQHNYAKSTTDAFLKSINPSDPFEAPVDEEANA